MIHLFLTDEVIDARREARLLHEVCGMCQGDKRDADVMLRIGRARASGAPLNHIQLAAVETLDW